MISIPVLPLDSKNTAMVHSNNRYHLRLMLCPICHDEVSAAYGEQKRLILPDSSEVWLNAGSSILYPETFAKDKRQVILNGEAYFSVKKDTEVLLL